MSQNPKTAISLASEIFRHPFMLAHKLDGEDPQMCAVHGLPLFKGEACLFEGVGCAAPYPLINADLPVVVLENLLEVLKTRTLEEKPDV